MNRRAAIAMSGAEVTAFLERQRTLIVATIGRDGWPHVMPLWYVVREGECWAWTYAKSQKVRNLERDARCTLQLEAGSTYGELRGLMIKCAAAIHRDLEVIAGVGTELAARYGGGGHVTPAQARKRVALQFVVKEVASFDHRKL
ncbi:pyridoxamine 5'-phosphate oxidase family protein [Candidatus Solirubrobacter pratensis]|uniref:pyridoxamine 5'-phosphate oxidase family protein n=1 Tax=Candidatus Solirubrobacter pratensis TaxID=1298857 RepID=UPI0003F797CD|nr:pyridoxamine 5'-phosphate oxidase family protein [Candidatus Solirubrobacter pratensis]